MATVDRPLSERRSGPQRTCAVCMEGVYVTKLETDTVAGPGSLHRFGIDPDEPGVLWHVEACDYCGHVQIFRRDWGRS